MNIARQSLITDLEQFKQEVRKMIKKIEITRNYRINLHVLIFLGLGLFLEVVLAETDNKNSVDPYLTYCKGEKFKDKQIPCKQIKIINNSNVPIYPVLSSSASGLDEWLQAEMKVQKGEEGIKKYPHKLVYRVYVNWPEGIPANQQVTLEVPFYSELVTNPNPTDFEQYINWWNGGRIAIYDKKQTLSNEHQADVKGGQFENLKIGVVTPQTPALQCAEVENNACKADALTVYSSGSLLTDEAPNQLTEYTFAGSSINGEEGKSNARNLAYQDVGYNISYVDHLYLPLAMAPIGNKYIGYTGTAKDFDTFQGYLKNFINSEQWPTFKINTDEGVIKLPGTYKLIIGSKANILTGNEGGLNQIYTLWKSCLAERFQDLPVTIDSNTKCPEGIKEKLERVTSFFELNRKQYESNEYPNNKTVEQNNMTCDDKQYYADMKQQGWNQAELLLARIYGWVPFNDKCPSGPSTNSLCKTTSDPNDPAINEQFNVATDCTQMYKDTHALYRQLQYSYTQPNIQPKFNPYVQLIHGEEFIHMDAYAFSIDDAVGFMQELGTGLVISVGGSQGLENPYPYNPKKAIIVSMGINPKLYPNLTWKSYGACPESQQDECIPNMQLPKNATGFKLGTINPNDFPLKVVIEDYNSTNKKSRHYEFIINAAPDESNGFLLPETSISKATCKSPGTWCDGNLVVHKTDIQTGDTVNYINTQPPYVSPEGSAE